MHKKNLLLICLAVLLLSGLVFLSVRTKTPSSPPVATTETPAPTGQLSEPEKKYLGGAGGYLVSLQKEDEKMVVAMAGASNGSYTLGEIKEVIEHAQTIENAGFYGDYNGGTPRPPGYDDLHQKIQEIHDRHVAVFGEYLEYWRDGNIAHITSASNKFQRTLKLVAQTFKDFNKLLAGKIEEQNSNKAKPTKKGAGPKSRR